MCLSTTSFPKQTKDFYLLLIVDCSFGYQNLQIAAHILYIILDQEPEFVFDIEGTSRKDLKYCISVDLKYNLNYRISS